MSGGGACPYAAADLNEIRNLKFEIRIKSKNANLECSKRGIIPAADNGLTYRGQPLKNKHPMVFVRVDFPLKVSRLVPLAPPMHWWSRRHPARGVKSKLTLAAAVGAPWRNCHELEILRQEEMVDRALGALLLCLGRIGFRRRGRLTRPESYLGPCALAASRGRQDAVRGLRGCQASGLGRASRRQRSLAA